MSDIGYKVSQEGDDVLTATDQGLIITSSDNSLKIGSLQSVVLTIASGSATATIAHGLSFRPIVIPFINLSGSTRQLLATFNGSPGLKDYYVDSTNIVFRVLAPFDSDGTQYTIYYFVSETESAA